MSLLLHQPTLSRRSSVTHDVTAGQISFANSPIDTSGPVTSSRPTSSLDTHLDCDELGQWSPVPVESFETSSRSLEASYVEDMTQPTATSFPVVALRDGVGRSFSVELSSGCVYRAMLAEHSESPLSKIHDCSWPHACMYAPMHIQSNIFGAFSSQTDA